MSFFAKLKSGLSKSSNKIGDGITGIFTKAKLEPESLEQLEELLIEADMGAATAAELVAALESKRFDKNISPEEVRTFLAEEIAKILAPVAKPLSQLIAHPSLLTILVVGVNGNGKTTTIGKLASKFKSDGKKIMFAAGDTFRAAAVEQLQVWGERSKIPVVSGAPEADSASVAFSALERARAENIDILIIDTAGRLHNKANLMEELAKNIRVLKKLDESAPQEVLLVLDATTGQNALAQVQTFKELVNVTGLIVTKLDGTAKGGVIVALAKQTQLPIYAIGVGEGIEDLDAFEPSEFARNLMGLN
jgi:fused signal recognition particle receptor